MSVSTLICVNSTPANLPSRSVYTISPPSIFVTLPCRFHCGLCSSLTIDSADEVRWKDLRERSWRAELGVKAERKLVTYDLILPLFFSRGA